MYCVVLLFTCQIGKLSTGMKFSCDISIICKCQKGRLKCVQDLVKGREECIFRSKREILVVDIVGIICAPKGVNVRLLSVGGGVDFCRFVEVSDGGSGGEAVPSELRFLTNRL